jgi:hypothetical protein
MDEDASMGLDAACTQIKRVRLLLVIGMVNGIERGRLVGLLERLIEGKLSLNDGILDEYR